MINLISSFCWVVRLSFHSPPGRVYCPSMFRYPSRSGHSAIQYIFHCRSYFFFVLFRVHRFHFQWGTHNRIEQRNTNRFVKHWKDIEQKEAKQVIWWGRGRRSSRRRMKSRRRKKSPRKRIRNQPFKKFSASIVYIYDSNNF